MSLLFYSILESLGENVLSKMGTPNFQIQKILQQDWGFFSKNPKQTDLVYIKNDGKELFYPNAQLSNLWGINRKARAQGTEVGLLFEEIEEKDIKKIKMFYSDFINHVKDEEFIKVENKEINPTMKGEYILFTGQFTPFPWAKDTKDKFIVEKYIKVNIE
ncbi:SdpA family antimicrobial peptide system protein [Staphylococcus xylosus]|uniref:SdpA family antimicrobial peptide system protein n=1 Tax=Staphylococcus xylosus TaxID=1288 RepID=UPI0021753030|nr:SdpA family antimicrobial peptide system protein [Staphylococcus xylosus]